MSRHRPQIHLPIHVERRVRAGAKVPRIVGLDCWPGRHRSVGVHEDNVSRAAIPRSAHTSKGTCSRRCAPPPAKDTPVKFTRAEMFASATWDCMPAFLQAHARTHSRTGTGTGTRTHTLASPRNHNPFPMRIFGRRPWSMRPASTHFVDRTHAWRNRTHCLGAVGRLQLPGVPCEYALITPRVPKEYSGIHMPQVPDGARRGLRHAPVRRRSHRRVRLAALIHGGAGVLGVAAWVVRAGKLLIATTACRQG